MSALPRELLLAEGMRTLLIPLLLGGAIAVLTYLSARSDWGRAKADGDAEAPDPIDTALEAAQETGVVVKEASRRVAELLRLASDIKELAAEQTILRETRLDYAIQDARDRLNAVATSLDKAENETRDAAASTVSARAKDELEGVAVVFSGLSTRHTTAANELPPPSARPADDKRAQSIKDTAAKVVVVAAPLAGAEEEVRQAQAILRAAGRPAAGEGVDRLVTAFTRLGPIDYLGHWINRRSRRYGPGVTGTMIVLLAALFFSIALALLHAMNLRMVVFSAIAAAVCIVVALVAWGLSKKWSMFDAWPRAILLLVAPVLIALAAFGSAISWYAVVIPVLTALIVWLALGAMHRWGSAGRVAWILFATIAFWSGALAFVGERWARFSTLDVAVVRQKSPAPAVAGLYIGRSGKAVYLAGLNTCHDRGCRRVMSIPDKQVTCVVFGPSVHVEGGRVTHLDGKTRAEVVPTNLAGFKVRPSDDVCAAVTATADASPAGTHTRVNVLNGLRIALGRDRSIAPTGGGRVVIGTVLFPFEGANLTPAAHAGIDVTAGEIRDSGARQVFVAGHADERGSDTLNVRLALRRAAAVERALRARLGQRVTIVRAGYGERLPLVCNRRTDGSDDRRSRALNRRVEIRTRRLMTYGPPTCGR